MATDHRRAKAKLVQGPMLDDPSFLKEIVQRVAQELLEAEMTEHISAASYERASLYQPLHCPLLVLPSGVIDLIRPL